MRSREEREGRLEEEERKKGRREQGMTLHHSLGRGVIVERTRCQAITVPDALQRTGAGASLHVNRQGLQQATELGKKWSNAGSMCQSRCLAVCSQHIHPTDVGKPFCWHKLLRERATGGAKAPTTREDNATSFSAAFDEKPRRNRCKILAYFKNV